MSNTKYTLKEVTTAQLEQEFINLPKRLYKGNRYWVCPLDDDIKAVFDPKKNKLFEDGEAIRWIAYDAKGIAVGRIAAFFDKEHAYSQDYEQPTGGCGFFEAVNDQELANLLFDTARLWLVSRGMEAMDGPINFGPRDSWWGLLVDGFEFQPLYSNPYNPPYYKELFENYGFQNYFNQNTYLWRVDDDDINSMIHQRAERLMNTPGYTFDHINMKDLESVAEDFRLIYNKAWSLFTGVTPMTKEEAQEIVKMLRPIIDPNIIFFTYFNNEPIGFFIMVPDINRIIGKFNGKLNLWNKLRLMWELKIRKSCDRIFGMIFAVTPEFQGKGVESGMIKYIYDSYFRDKKTKYRTVEFAWIGDFNPVMNRMIQNYVCATRHKMHTTYRYLFDRTKEFKRCPRLGFKRSEK